MAAFQRHGPADNPLLSAFGSHRLSDERRAPAPGSAGGAVPKVAHNQQLKGNTAKPSTVLQSFLESVHAEFKGLHEGDLATYIPELGKANPDHFGICIVTLDGVVYEVGDSRAEFTIQSVSKPFVYGIALEDNKLEDVMDKIGVEPTGQAFNVLSVDERGHPKNPLINAGAIGASSLVAGSTGKAKFDRILKQFSRFAGRPLTLDTATFESERRTGHRNRGFAHMLKQADVIEGDVNEAVDVYFKQCSINVNARDLATMAATVANGGVNPVTGNRTASASVMHRVLGVMSTCGMYDSSGEWLFNVGMPAKSGVGGGIMAVLPGQLAIATFSPRLDHVGHSVRGVHAIKRISSAFDLHFLAISRAARSVIRGRINLALARSRRVRPESEISVLDQYGSKYAVLLLQGDLSFAAIERVLREVAGCPDAERGIILDLKHVSKVNKAAVRLLLSLTTRVRLLISHSTPFAESLRAWKSGARQGRLLPGDLPGSGDNLLTFDHLDAALECAENDLIETYTPEGMRAASELEPETHPYLDALSKIELHALKGVAVVESFKEMQPLFSVGDESDRLFLVLKGAVYVSLPSNAALRMRGDAGKAGKVVAAPKPRMAERQRSIVLEGKEVPVELDEDSGEDDELLIPASSLAASPHPGAVSPRAIGATLPLAVGAGTRAGAGSVESSALDALPTSPTSLRRDVSSGFSGSTGFRTQTFSMLMKFKKRVHELKARRVATVGCGSAVGDSALVSNALRTVDVIADSGGAVCMVITTDNLEQLGASGLTGIRPKLVERMAIEAHRTIARLNNEMMVLTG